MVASVSVLDGVIHHMDGDTRITDTAGVIHTTDTDGAILTMAGVIHTTDMAAVVMDTTRHHTIITVMTTIHIIMARETAAGRIPTVQETGTAGIWLSVTNTRMRWV